MPRGGRAKNRDEPERRCIVTGDRGGKAGLVRFVVGPEDTVVADVAEKLPGRGMWVTADAESLAKAVKRGAFNRAAKRSVKAASDLPETVDRLLAGRVIDLISLARRAGEALAGYEKVKAVLDAERALCLLQAADGSPRERRRLRPPHGDNSHFTVLTAAELGLAFGRDRVIHAALVSGGLGRRVQYESARLAGMRRNQG